MTDIAFDNVRFRYNPIDPLALDGVSFTIPAGSRVAIVGSSGSGKSTIVNLLLRFWDYHEGQITIGGHDLRDLSRRRCARAIGRGSADTFIYSMPLSRTTCCWRIPDATVEQIVDACRQAQLHDFIAGLPLKYDTLIGENGLLLSGGERQRLAIARAILKNAPILILDEATANLDAITEQHVLAALEPFMIGRTVIIISHRRTVIEHVDRVIELEQGRVVNRSLTNFDNQSR